MIRNAYIGMALCLALFTGRTALGSAFSQGLTETTSTMRFWRVKDGLPSDVVTAIVQTRDGFLWIGTGAGLVRFDGVTFSGLKADGSVTNQLTEVTALAEDSDGRLWIGTRRNGLFRLFQGSLAHYAKEEGLLDNGVTSLAADAHGQVWIGGNAGLNLWDGKQFFSFTVRDGLPDEAVSGVNVARSGTVWITTRVGMSRFSDGKIVPYFFQTDSQGRSPEYLGAYEDRRGNLWAFGDTYLINLAEGKRFNYFRGSEPEAVRIWSLCEGQDGRLWIGTSGRGLLCFEDNRFQPVVLGEDRWPYDVRAMCEDRGGNLWLGTAGGGLAQLRTQSIHVLRSGQVLPDSPPTTLALDADERVYVGLQRGGLWAGDSDRFERVGGGLDLTYSVTAVAAAADGTVWTGTAGGGLYGMRGGQGVHLTTADGLAENSLALVCADRETNVWLSTSAGALQRLNGDGLKRFDPPGAAVSAMLPAKSGGLWLGTRTGGVLREVDGTFTNCLPAEAGDGTPVLALAEGGQQRLWIGTAGGGLTCLANGLAVSWTTNSGLIGTMIGGVVEDERNNLWLASDDGIFYVANNDLQKALGTPGHPLACKPVSNMKLAIDPVSLTGVPRLALAPSGSLWFAVAEGLLNVDTRQTKTEPSAFPVCIENFAINGQTPVSLLPGSLWTTGVTNDAVYKMPVDLHSLEIHFTALDFSAPEDLQFRHKLEGSDSEWVNDQDGRSVRYGKLYHSSYKFRVQARLAGGPWHEAGQTFAFIVPTPLYLQFWAICLYVFVIMALVAECVRLITQRRFRNRLKRLEQQQALERERMRIARDMHDEMGSKLTKLSFLSEHIQMEIESGGQIMDKVQSISQTSQDLLKTMDEIVWVVNPRNDTLENLTAYLSHYAVEYFAGTSIDCELRLSPELPNLPLSSETRHNLFLTFEEALNNVLKHSGADKVRVEFLVNDRDFELKITDNGKGFETPAADGQARGARGGNGLKNMRQRLASIGGECEISSRPGAGCVVTARFRLASPTEDRK